MSLRRRLSLLTRIYISIDTQHLLMEGLRIVDEWTLIEGKITLDTVFGKKTDDVAELSEEERDILFLVDGENDVSTIIDLTSKDNFEVSIFLLSLIDKGLMASVEVAPIIVREAVVEEKKPLPFAEYLPLAAVFISLLFAVGGVMTYGRSARASGARGCG